MTQPTPLNICIYCCKTDVELTDEHIVPKGFGNTAGDILFKASCKKCASETSKFELVMLRDNLQPIRTVLQLATRSKKASSIPQKVKYRDGREEILDIPHDKYLGMIGLPIFSAPAILQKIYDSEQLSLLEMQMINIGNIKNKKWYKNKGIDEFHTYIFKSNKNQSFARFIMKVSYCAAVKYYGYDRVKDSPVRPIIIGRNPYIASWFGNLGENTFPDKPQPNSLIRYAVGEINNRLVVSVQFFAIFDESPIYHTII